MPPITHRTAATLRRHLTDLPDLVDQARTALVLGTSRSPSTGNPNSPGSRPPLNVALLALLDRETWNGEQRAEGEEPSVSAVLSFWCEVFSGQPCISIPAACDYLLRAHDETCEHPNATTYAADIAWLHGRLVALAGPLPLRPLPLPCPACGRRALGEPQAGPIRCGHCGHRLERARYAELGAAWYQQTT